jgi:hypothetical protein
MRADQRQGRDDAPAFPVLGADQEIAGRGGKIGDGRAEPQLDFRMRRHRAGEHLQQFGACHHTPGVAIAARHVGEGDAAQQPAADARTDIERPRRRRGLGKGIADPETGKDVAHIGRELDAGADLAQPIGALADDGREAALGQRQRRGQTADAGPGDDDIAPLAQTRSPIAGRKLRRFCADQMPGRVGLGRAER